MIYGATNAFNASTSYDLISRLLVIIVLGGMGSLGGALVAGIAMVTIEDLVVSRVVARVVHVCPSSLCSWSSSRFAPKGSSVSNRLRVGLVLRVRESVVGRWRWSPRSSSRMIETNPDVHDDRRLHSHLHGVRDVVEHVLGLLGLHRSRFGRVLRHRGLHDDAVVDPLAHCLAPAMFWLVPLGGLVAMVVAVPIGLVALRVRRHTFVVITIAIFFVFQLSAINFVLHRRHRGTPLPYIPWGASTSTCPSITWRWASLSSRRSCRWRCDARASASSCSPSETTRTGPWDSASRSVAVKLTGFAMSAFTDRHVRRALRDVPGADLSPVRLRSPLRHLHRADGVLRGAGHGRGPAARRARPRVAPAVPDRLRTPTGRSTSCSSGRSS